MSSRRTPRTGKSDSRARSPLSRTIPARSAPAGERRSTRDPLQCNRSGRPLDAGERAQELHLPVSLGARDAEDLALADREVDRPEPRAPELARSRAERLVGRRPVALGEGELERATDHQGDQVVLGHAGDVERALAHPVTQHRHAIGDAEHLRQAVAHVDDADAARHRARGRGRGDARPLPGPSAVVGSSSKRTAGFESSALTTSSICRCGERQAPDRARGHRSVRSNSSSRSAAHEAIAP